MSVNVTNIDDCFLHDKERLKHDEALGLLHKNLKCVAGETETPLAKANSRILSANINAPHNVPLHTNAAVDGYAFAHADLNEKAISVSQRIAAGDLSPAALQTGTAARIFTGAVMPKGADSVAMQEDCEVTGKLVRLPAALKSGANCRLAGEDLKSGETVLQAGDVINATRIAAAASIGLSKLPVREKLTIGLLSSGNEMRRVDTHDKKLLAGEVWDANAPMLSALLQALPVNINDHGIVDDTARSVENALTEMASVCDVIITTGGASRGVEDHMLSSLDKLGKRHLWQLAIKPGRPMMFGQIRRQDHQHDCYFFGLPGNPVAALVCFLLYVRPALARLAGANWTEPQRYPLMANFELLNKKTDRREFLRGILKTDAGGNVSVNKFERDGSGLISSLRTADGLIEIPEKVTQVKKGDMVSFLPFSQYF